MPAVEFDRFAADGGDLDPAYQKILEAQGVVFRRVPNDHDDVHRFKADIVIAFEELFGGEFPVEPVNSKREQRQSL